MPLVDGIGCWSSVRASGDLAPGRPALFLDRDGVLVEEVGFLRDRSDVALIKGAARVIAACNNAGIPVVVVTNQSGIARGILDWSDFEEVQLQIESLLAQAGARVDAVYACGYHADGRGSLGVRDHAWCKPNPGMLAAAAQELALRPEISWVVGDRARDLEAGRNAGLAGGVQVMTGHATEEQREMSQALGTNTFQVLVAQSITDVDDVVARMTRTSTC